MLTIFRRGACVRSRLLAVAICAPTAFIALGGRALADDGPQIATATTQDLLSRIPQLSIIWHGRRISAMPFRIRILDEASPLAYSLDIRRPVKYGDSWAAISLGRSAHPEDRSLPS